MNATDIVGKIGYATEFVNFHNDMGGTQFLPDGKYRVKIVHTFYDYETGQVVHGILLDDKDIELARKIGTTGHDIKDNWNEEIKKARAEFLNPPKVYFYSDDFIEC